MNEIILCKLGEVVLKGLNRRSFEMKLMSNIRRRTARFGKFRIYSKQSTIYVEPAEETCDLSGAYAACKQVFGIIAIARAVPCPKEKEAILATAKTYLGEALTAARNFKVESKRADKMFPMNSIQLSQAVGGDLAELFPHVAVDVHTPDLTVFVEIREKYAYVHTPSVPGAGGLPIGMGGRAVSLLSGGIDSPVASYMMAKRGVQLEMIHFASPPYTGELAREKGLFLMECMWVRFLPKIQKVKEWVETGRIGRLKCAQGNLGFYAGKDLTTRAYNPALGGGSMYDLGVYLIEVLGYFATEPLTQVESTVVRAPTGVDETASFLLRYGDYLVDGQCSVGTALPENGGLYGEEGYIALRERLHTGSRVELYDKSGRLVEEYVQEDVNGFIYQVREAVRCIGAGLLESPTVPHSMTLECCRVFEQVLGA